MKRLPSLSKFVAPYAALPTWHVVTVLTGAGMIAVSLAIMLSPGPGVLSVLSISGTGNELQVFALVTAICGMYKVARPESTLAPWMLLPLVVWNGAAFDYVNRLPDGAVGKSFTGATLIAFLLVSEFVASTRGRRSK